MSTALRPLQAVIDFLGGEGADALPHGHGRSLLHHLVGTHAILRAWRQPEWLQHAGLCHSVYSTDVYRRTLMGHPDRRARLRSVIGSRAEHLVYLFCTLSRRDLFDRTERLERIPALGADIDEGTGSGSLHVTAGEIALLLLLHFANAAEQACAPDRGPAPWLARWSQRAQLLRHAPVTVPGVFDHCTCTISAPVERGLLTAYRTALAQLGHSPLAAESALRAACDIGPWVAEPFALLAGLLQRRGAMDEAREMAERARALSNLWATPWDKRLTQAQWRALTASLAGVDRDDAHHAALHDEATAALRRTCERVATS